MKKLITLTLAAIFCMALLTACGGGSTPAPPSEGDDAEEAATGALLILPTEYITENYAIAVQKDNVELLDAINGALGELKADGTLDAIVDKYINGVEHSMVFQQEVAADAPTLTMGTNPYFPPYEFYDGVDIVGIDAEVASAIADKLGYKLVIEDMEFDAVLVAVQTGSIDMAMAGITVTEERQQSMSFTDSYATGMQVVIVLEGGPIADVTDLFAEDANYRIGTQMATTGFLYATWDIEEAGLGTVQGYNKGADAVLALIAGQVDCVIIDNEPAKAFVQFHNAG